MGTGTLGADLEEAVGPEQARSTTSGDGVDVELGCLQGNAGRGCLEDVLVRAGIPGDV